MRKTSPSNDIVKNLQGSNVDSPMGAGCALITFVNLITPVLTLPIRSLSGPAERVKQYRSESWIDHNLHARGSVWQLIKKHRKCLLVIGLQQRFATSVALPSVSARRATLAIAGLPNVMRNTGNPNAQQIDASKFRMLTEAQRHGGIGNKISVPS